MEMGIFVEEVIAPHIWGTGDEGVFEGVEGMEKNIAGERGGEREGEQEDAVGASAAASAASAGGAGGKEGVVAGGAGAGVVGAGRREVVYQLEPTLRVHMPGQRALGAKHVDYSYKRQPTELNVWLPLTKVGEGNTLWAESTPGTIIYIYSFNL